MKKPKNDNDRALTPAEKKRLEREDEIMRELRGRSHCVTCGRSHERAWKTPMWVGGRDASHHSGTLRRMAKNGLILKRERSGGPCRPAYAYRKLGLEMCPKLRQLSLFGGQAQ
jgi:hypothetical protein